MNDLLHEAIKFYPNLKQGTPRVVVVHPGEVILPELGESLGILRTEELLAARKLDGAEQYFTRAFDFGFTRSAD